MGLLVMSKEASAAANPAAGNMVLYPKTGGWFYRDETGAEVQFADSAAFPAGVANTYLRRNAGNTAYDTKTPQNVADELQPLMLPTMRFTENLIINGDFNIWQRGTSVAQNLYGPDRFFVSHAGTSAITLAQSTDTPAVTQMGGYSTYSASITVNTAQPAMGAGDYMALAQHIEGYNAAAIYGQNFTVSFWVKSSLTGTYSVALRNGGTDQSYAATIIINAANTWEYKTIAVPTWTLAGTWNYTNGTGLALWITLSCGSTYTAPSANQWLSGNYVAAPGQVNFAATAGNVFKLKNIKVAPGTVATPFVPRPIQQELLLCQRYYSNTVPYGLHVGNAAAVNEYVWLTVFYPTIMRVSPSLGFNQTGIGNLGSVTQAQTSSAGCILQAQTLNTGRAYAYGYLLLDAEL